MSMPKKRKTLPKNIKELIETKDISALKVIYDTCEINAYNDGFNRDTILHRIGVPDELVRWLVEQGANINARNHYEETPVHNQAGYWCGNVTLFIELGADITTRDIFNRTPLHSAACYGRVESVKVLIAHGADIHAKERSGKTPLSYALSLCTNIKIPGVADVAELLLNAGAEITPDMTNSVTHIGKGFEFYRADFNKDSLAETEAGLAKLYALFHVEPVAKRIMHNGISPIVVPDGDWDHQFNTLWQLLVPGSGQAKTVQAEVIRASGKLAREIIGNGSPNWNDDFRKMLVALVEYFNMGNPLSPDELEEAARLARKLRGGNGDDEPGRLMELSVHWVQANPKPMPLDKPEYSI